MTIGILKDTGTAEIFLNNLSEIEVNLKDVSVIMKNQTLRNKIAGDTGPLKGKTGKTLSAFLLKHKILPEEIKVYTNAIEKDGVFVAVKTNSNLEKVIIENMKDSNALQVKTL